MKCSIEKWSIEPTTYDTLYALDEFRKYWSATEALITSAAKEEEERNGPKWIPKNEDDLGEYYMERQLARHLHDQIMAPMFRYSCIVSLYTVVERELKRLMANLEKERGQQKLSLNDIRGGSYLAQVAKFAGAFYGLQMTNCPQYEALCDLQKIRNCITHCRGEVSLLPDKAKAYLVSLVERRPGFYAWKEGGDLEIEAACVEQFIKDGLDFFTWLFSELKWKIDDSWTGNRWMQPLGGSKTTETKKR